MYYQIRYIYMGNKDNKQVKKTAREYYDFWGGDETQIIFELNKVLESTPLMSEIERFWLDVRKEIRVIFGYKKPKIVKEPTVYDDEEQLRLAIELTKKGFWEGNRQKDEGIADWHKKAIEQENDYWEMMKELALLGK